MENKNPNESFFGSTPSENGNKNNKPSQEFVMKGGNRGIDEPYDIHFTISGGVFSNLMKFISEINYDVFFQFKKKELIIAVIDPGTSHSSLTKFDLIEFTDYHVNGLEKDEDEKYIYMDISVMVDELSINEEKPIDMYIDTLIKHRYYVISGKEIIRNQLNASNNLSEILQRYINFTRDFVGNFLTNENYQKIILNSSSLTSTIKSLTKKKLKKGKDKTVIVSLVFNKTNLDWIIEDETKASSTMLSGEDVMVYPIREEIFDADLDFIVKYGLLKSTYTTGLYTNGNNLPLIIENKLGGLGKITNYYLIAPRVKTE